MKQEFFDLDESWRLLAEALAAESMEARVVVWNDPVEWSSWDLVLANYMWGYVADRDPFLDWVRHVTSVTTLVNSEKVLRWNSDKRHMNQLAAAEVPTVPTKFVQPGGRWELPPQAFVVKPSVGSGGIDAARYDPGEARSAQAHVDRLHAAGQTVMVQPYQTAIDGEGETNLVFLGGTYSHAVRKIAAMHGKEAGERPWEQEVVTRAEATTEQRAVAEAALRTVYDQAGPIIYGRVDLVPGPDQRPRVLEVELVEPSLFLDLEPAAAALLASALRKGIQQ